MARLEQLLLGLPACLLGGLGGSGVTLDLRLSCLQADLCVGRPAFRLRRLLLGGGRTLLRFGDQLARLGGPSAGLLDRLGDAAVGVGDGLLGERELLSERAAVRFRVGERPLGGLGALARALELGEGLLVDVGSGAELQHLGCERRDLRVR